MVAEKGFSIEATAREIMLDHMPPMKPGRQGEVELVLDALALYLAVKVGLKAAWCDGETAGMMVVEEVKVKEMADHFEAGRQQAMDSVDEWHRPPGH